MLLSVAGVALDICVNIEDLNRDAWDRFCFILLVRDTISGAAPPDSWLYQSVRVMARQLVCIGDTSRVTRIDRL